MKKNITLAAAVILALLFNIEWKWSPSPNSEFTWGGPLGGIAVCIVVCMVLVYRGFLAFQDFLIARRYLASRVTTTFDLLPWLVLMPLGITYIARGDGWSFRWGENELRFWYFIALIVSVFIFQIYTMIRRVADNAKTDT